MRRIRLSLGFMVDQLLRWMARAKQEAVARWRQLKPGYDLFEIEVSDKELTGGVDALVHKVHDTLSRHAFKPSYLNSFPLAASLLGLLHLEADSPTPAVLFVRVCHALSLPAIPAFWRKDFLILPLLASLPKKERIAFFRFYWASCYQNAFHLRPNRLWLFSSWQRFFSRLPFSFRKRLYWFLAFLKASINLREFDPLEFESLEEEGLRVFYTKSKHIKDPLLIHAPFATIYVCPHEWKKTNDWRRTAYAVQFLLSINRHNVYSLENTKSSVVPAVSVLVGFLPFRHLMPNFYYVMLGAVMRVSYTMLYAWAIANLKDSFAAMMHLGTPQQWQILYRETLEGLSLMDQKLVMSLAYLYWNRKITQLHVYYALRHLETEKHCICSILEALG